MKNADDSLNRAFEEVLSAGISLAAEEMGRELSEEKEDVTVSVKFENRVEALFKRERRKAQTMRVLSVASRSVCVLIICMVIGFASIMSVDAWRVKFMNFVFDRSAPGTEITFGDKKNNYVTVGNVTLHYVPDGFETDYIFEGSYSTVFTLKNEDKYISVSVDDIDGESLIDTENAVVERIWVNGKEGVISITEDVTILLWHDDEFAYTVYGDIDASEIIKIAENAEIVKKH